MKEKNWINRTSSKLKMFPLQMTLTKIKKTRCRLGKYIHKPHTGHRNQTIQKNLKTQNIFKKSAMKWARI